ncbi:MAG: hypothetical protein H7Z76_12535 [Methylotenera sp.]|nr:hypothetical protein [Flavobacterium sp.]
MKKHLFFLLLLTTYFLSCYSQTRVHKKLKNGNVINYTSNDLPEWKDTSVFNPGSILKDGNYNIKCYTIFPLKPNDLIQIYGYKQFSNNYMTVKDFNTQLISLYKKKANTEVDLTFKRTKTIDLILQQYISQFPIDKQNYLTEVVDSLFFDLKNKGAIKQNVEIFHESSSCFLFGIVTKIDIPSFGETISISSFSGSILLNNHPYGLSIILDGNAGMLIEKKYSLCKNFISRFENINHSK